MNTKLQILIKTLGLNEAQVRVQAVNILMHGGNIPNRAVAMMMGLI